MTIHSLIEEAPTYQEIWQPLGAETTPLYELSPDDYTGQIKALVRPFDECLFAGTRGSGKTEAQLMRFQAQVGRGYGAFWRGILFDVEYKDLADIIAKARRWFNQDQARPATFLASAAALKWVWNTGEELLFRVGKDENDYWHYHGHEYPFIGFNELTKWATPDFYDAIQSTNRSSFRPTEDTPHTVNADGSKTYHTPNGLPLPPIPLQAFSTTNSYGKGRNWVKKRFVDPVSGISDKYHVTKNQILDPKTQKEITVTKRSLYIWGSWKENPHLDAKYISTLTDIKDKAKRDAWLNGSWDIVSGGAIDDVFDRDVHVVEPFDVPENWRLTRSMDWGSSSPYSVGWWAEANGEEFQIRDGSTRWVPKGTIFQIGELYGSEEIGTNKGTKEGSKKVAKKIIEHEEAMRERGLVSGTIWAGPADNSINSVSDDDTKTTADLMAEVGVKWTKSDKAKGSRVIGLELMRERLEASLDSEGAGLYFFSNCIASISTIPGLPRDEKNPDDVDTDAEDHAYDMVRYKVLDGSRKLTKPLKVRIG